MVSAYAHHGRRQRPGVPGTSLCRSKLRAWPAETKFKVAGRAGRRPLGYLCSGVGLMFSSIQAMNMVGLFHSGRSVMCQLTKSVNV
jgi:hypothetical protein